MAWLWHGDRRGREGIDYLRRAIDRAPTDRSRLQARLLTGLALVADTASPLDLEVVRLVAGGLSNPQIGARLFISRGTVKTHLSHIFAKLDTSNRTELAAAATDRGLH